MSKLQQRNSYYPHILHKLQYLWVISSVIFSSSLFIIPTSAKTFSNNTHSLKEPIDQTKVPTKSLEAPKQLNNNSAFNVQESLTLHVLNKHNRQSTQTNTSYNINKYTLITNSSNYSYKYNKHNQAYKTSTVIPIYTQEQLLQSALEYLSYSFPTQSFQFISFSPATDDSINDILTIINIETNQTFELKHFYKNPLNYWSDTIYFSTISDDYSQEIKSIINNYQITDTIYSKTNLYKDSSKLKNLTLKKFLKSKNLSSEVKTDIFIREKDYNYNLDLNQIKQELENNNFKGVFNFYVVPNEINSEKYKTDKTLQRKAFRIDINNDEVLKFDKPLVSPFENTPCLKFDDTYLPVENKYSENYEICATAIIYYPENYNCQKITISNSYLNLSESDEMEMLKYMGELYENDVLTDFQIFKNNKSLYGIVFTSIYDDYYHLRIFEDVGFKTYLQIDALFNDFNLDDTENMVDWLVVD